MGTVTPATSIAACRFCRRRCAFRCHDTLCRRDTESGQAVGPKQRHSSNSRSIHKRAWLPHLASELRELGRHQRVNGSGLGIQADAQLQQRLVVRRLRPAAHTRHRRCMKKKEALLAHDTLVLPAWRGIHAASGLVRQRRQQARTTSRLQYPTNFASKCVHPRPQSRTCAAVRKHLRTPPAN